MNAFVVAFLALLGGVILFINLYTPESIKHPPSIIGTDQPIVFAHRGSRVLNPENTLLAFQNALDFGADVIETDVQLTKDRRLVIFHDDKLDRVTNASGLVADFTVSELKKLDAGYRFTHDNGTTFPFRGKGIHISTPEEVFEAFPNAYFNIEIKNPDIQAADLLYEVIMAKSMQRRVVVGGRWCPCIRHFRTISADQHIQTSACETEVMLFLLHAFLRTSTIWYSLLYPLNTQSLQVPTSSGGFRLDTVSVLSALKQQGKHVHYWVINEPDEIRRLLTLGADGIITDRPDITVQVFESMGLKGKSHRDIYSRENSRYYVPVDTHIEIHTCVGIICFVLQKFYYQTVACTVSVIMLIFYYVWRKRTNKKKKQA